MSSSSDPAPPVPERGSTGSRKIANSFRAKLGTLEALYKKVSYRRKYGQNSSRFETKDPAFGLVNLFTLKVLFIDIFISLGDVISDFAQGYSLFTSENEDNHIFGFVTLGVIWLPGVAAAIHLVSMYRQKMKIKDTAKTAALLVVFYPIIPFLAYVNMLWRRPKKKALAGSLEASRFREAEYKAMIAHSISGGIEAPVQFILQVWLILNGKIPQPWTESSLTTLTDWHGNRLMLPNTSTISLIYSFLSITKAVLDFNIVRVHVQEITDGRKILSSLVIICDHLPFLAVSAFFRIMATAFLLTYLNSFGFAPLAAFWLLVLAFGYRSFDLEKIPLWLISFISIFFPICCTTYDINDTNRHHMIALQYKTFRYQSLVSLLVFLPSLAVCFWIVNFDRQWIYDSNVILDNTDFNVGLAVITSMGLASYVLSVRPSWFNMVRAAVRAFETNRGPLPASSQIALDPRGVSGLDEPDHLEMKGTAETDHAKVTQTPFEKVRITRQELKTKGIRILGGLVLLLILSIPALLPNALLMAVKSPQVYISYQLEKNSTRIIQGIPLTSAQADLSGCLHYYFGGKNSRFTSDNSSKSFSSCTSDRILHLSRSDWPSCVQSECFLNVSGVIVSDDDPSCDQNTMHNCFRPSFPSSDLSPPSTLPTNVPMILVQKTDATWIFPSWEECEENTCKVHLAMKNSTIPYTNFKCDLVDDRQCLPRNPQESLIDPVTRHIRGSQYRSVFCQWGERKCFGYWNMQERLELCDGPKIRYSFCRNGYNFNDEDPLEYQDRIFKSKGPTEGFNRCLTTSHVDKCDRSDLPNWSHGLQCDRQGADKIVQKRYCELSKECLLEEIRMVKDGDKCTHDDW